jgi:aminobenzoyl-glutamate transport protein
MTDELKKKKKKLINNCILFFVLLTLGVMIISTIGSVLELKATYTKAAPGIPYIVDPETVTFQNMFSGSELRYIIGNAISNFIIFAPLGLLLISAMGIGIAYKSGLLATIFASVGKFFSRFWLTFILAILCILSTFISDVSYVIMIPLAAIFFLSNGRNPISGMLVAFVSVASGCGVNFLATNLDYSLTPYTVTAGKIIDESFNMGFYGNIFFSIVGSILLAFLIAYITEKIIIPRIPKYKRDEDVIDEIEIGRREKRGLILASIGAIVLILIYVYMLIPGLPSSGILLDSAEPTYLGKLFGANAFFKDSFIYVISFILAIAGLLYGLGARTIKNGEQFTDTLYDSLNNIGSILVLIFFASEFIAVFKETNIGTIVTVWLTNLVQQLSFSSAPLILLFIIIVAIANVFLTSPITKWAILSPVIIPLFMEANITPEFTQAIYRVSESATNILTPLFAAFVIFIGYLEIYNKDEHTLSIRNCYKMLWPYAVGIGLLWIFIIISWYIVGLPIGINAYPTV